MYAFAWILTIGMVAVGLVSPALAYVGPGAGITMLGALWAVIAAVGLAFVGVVLWPIRRLLGRNKAKAAQSKSDGAVQSSSGE